MDLQSGEHVLAWVEKQDYDTVQSSVASLGLTPFFDKRLSQFVERLQACERSMFLMQPRRKGGDQAVTALSYFRQWLSAELLQGHGSDLSGAYAKMYHTIEKENVPEEENQDAIRNFASQVLRGSGTTHLAQLVSEVEAVFKAAAEIIRPILKDSTGFQPEGEDPDRDLTFMQIRDEELPWTDQVRARGINVDQL